MATLDCENPDAVLNSLSEIYLVEKVQLIEFLQKLDIDAHYEANKPELDSKEEMRRLLENCFGPPKENISQTYWYHLTRAEAGANFEEGLLPLDIVLPRIWQMLLRIVGNSNHAERLIAMSKEGVSSFQYNLKTTNSLHSGPYAMLIKEIGACANSVGNHDYLKIPEIIEDICSGYETHFGESIQPIIELALTPTVVKFWSESKDHLYALSPAIYYAYQSCRGLELSSLANTCFDGKGKAVPKERISYIEQVNHLTGFYV